MKIVMIVLLILNFINFAIASENLPEFKDGEVKFLKVNLKNINDEDLKNLKVKIFNLTFSVFKGKNEDYYTLISSPLGVTPGEYDLKIFKENEVLYETKVPVTNRVNIETEEILYAPEINVLPKSSKLVLRVSQEDQDLKKTLMIKTDEKLWTGEFITPVKAKINSHFGLYRVYSKHLRRRTHWGVDYHVGVGTKVKASADGVVVMAKELYFPGKTIVIDHGLGLYTGYSHLSKMTVKVGDKIKKGQSIGKSGKSGKVTGAHLHWFGVNGRVKFDPLTLLNVN